MISTDLRHMANILAERDDKGFGLTPDECSLLARGLYALANRVAVMEHDPIPESKRRGWRLTVIDGGAA